MHRYPAEGGQPPPALIPHTAETGTALRPGALLLVQSNARCPLPSLPALISSEMLEHEASVRLAREARVDGSDVLATDVTAWLRVMSVDPNAPITERPSDASPAAAQAALRALSLFPSPARRRRRPAARPHPRIRSHHGRRIPLPAFADRGIRPANLRSARAGIHQNK